MAAHARLWPPVAVHSEPERGRAIDEGAIRLVQPREVGFPVVCDVDVDAPVAVEIVEDHPEPAAGSGEPRRLGDIGERAVSVVAVQNVG